MASAFHVDQFLTGQCHAARGGAGKASAMLSRGDAGDRRATLAHCTQDPKSESVMKIRPPALAATACIALMPFVSVSHAGDWAPSPSGDCIDLASMTADP